jgi:uncharacterized protein (DUF1800 family)
MRATKFTGFAKAIAIVITILISTGQIFFIAIQTKAKDAKTKHRGLSNDQKITQLLTRLTFGIRPGDFEHVKAIGFNEFIAQQLDPESMKDSALDERLRNLPTLTIGTPELIEQYTPPKPAPSPSPQPSMSVLPSPAATATSAVAEQKGIITPSLSPSGTEQQMKMEKTQPQNSMMQNQVSAQEMKPAGGEAMKGSQPSSKPPTPKPVKNPQLVVTELQRAALLRAVYSERQLFELMVNFWENHFSIFANKDADRFLLTEFDRDTIRPFALGNFRDLLGATARSSAMLYYLDNWQSSVQRHYPATNDKPARTVGGINENYARELMELHTLGVDGGYTQEDVQEVARCFTGWTIRKPNEVGLFFFNPRAHDNGEKIVLGHKIPAGGGISDGDKVLDILAGHPSTANFIATKLARRFVRDDPPRSVINRAAATFLKTSGSIRETLRTIITSPEFFSAAAYRAKMRTPFEYVAAAMRAVKAETDADPSVFGWIARMGQPIFGRLTPDGYPDRAAQWLAAGSMLERLNFAVALSNNKLKGTHIDPARILSQTDLNSPAAAADHLSQLILTGGVSDKTRGAIDKIAREASDAPATASTLPATRATQPINYANTAVVDNPKTPVAPLFVAGLISMVLGSPEFQRR